MNNREKITNVVNALTVGTETQRDHYSKFLYAYQQEGGPLCPTPDMDTVWHAHILDTRRYADDCQRLFGRFLHHSPGKPETKVRQRTAEIFARLFDESLVWSDKCCGGYEAGCCCDDGG